MNVRFPAFVVSAAAICVAVFAQDNKPAPAPSQPPATAPAADPFAGVPMDMVSYRIGKNIGAQMGRQGFTPDYKAMVDGIRDAIENKEPRYSKAELDAAMEKFSAAMTAAEAMRQEKAQGAGKDFLAANGKKQGVSTTASGLQYEVLKAGNGPKPIATDTVTVHYRGTLTDGTEFDSSYSRNEPAKFQLNGVIPGWTEGVQLMSKGSKFKFVIPSNLAYGPEGSPPTIGPNAVLIFEIELLDIAGK